MDYIFILLGGFLSTFIGSVVLAYFLKGKKLLSDSKDKYHAVHSGDVPRSGGIILYITFLLVSSFFSEQLFLVILAFLPTFLYSVYEDINGDTPQKVRLVFMTVSTFVAVVLTGLSIKSAGFFDIPEFLQIPLTIFAVVGLTSAINFIDGLNGLASGVSILAFLFLGLASGFLGNDYYMFLSLLFAFIVFGFFVVNFFTGKIFLGDTGAYFLGYFLGMYSVYLLNNIEQLNPWYPLALVAYPVIETFFTIIRRLYRKKGRGREFFKAEKVHLHTILYKRHIRVSNSLSSFLILEAVFLFNLLAFAFIENSVYLLSLIFAELVVYWLSYRFLFNYKTEINKKMLRFVPNEKAKIKEITLKT